MRMEVNEIKIPAPWGDIAVKTWGVEANEAVIATHGFMDNAGSFDNLIPLLSKNYYYLCIDLPGHGLSTGFHHSTPIITVDYVLVFKIVADFFGRKNYILIGHSYGGQLSVLFSQMYPELVSKLILLDAVSYYPFLPESYLDYLEAAIEILFKSKTLKSRSLYSYEEAVSKLMAGRSFGQLTRQAAENLANRNFEKIGVDQYSYRVDPRLKQRLNPGSDMDYIVQTHRHSPVKSKVLMLLFNQTGLDKFFDLVYKYFQEQHFEIHNLDGHHDYHNTNPEHLAPIINEFLMRNNKL